MTQNKTRDEQLEKYIKLCRDNWHSVYGISEAYCRADFTAGWDYAEKQYLGEIESLKADLEKFSKESITFSEMAKWLEKNRQGFYLGCRIGEHSEQVGEFVEALHYYLEKDFGFTSNQRALKSKLGRGEK